MRKLFFISAILLTILIALGSLISPKDIPKVDIRFSDKIVHFFAYFVLALNWFFAVNLKNPVVKKIFLTGFFVLLFGIIIEILQKNLTSNRKFEFYDILVNFGGIIFAVIIFVVALKLPVFRKIIIKTTK